jgi:hypothetical protein
MSTSPRLSRLKPLQVHDHAFLFSSNASFSQGVEDCITRLSVCRGIADRMTSLRFVRMTKTLRHAICSHLDTSSFFDHTITALKDTVRFVGVVFNRLSLQAHRA